MREVSRDAGILLSPPGSSGAALKIGIGGVFGKAKMQFVYSALLQRCRDEKALLFIFARSDFSRVKDVPLVPENFDSLLLEVSIFPTQPDPERQPAVRRLEHAIAKYRLLFHSRNQISRVLTFHGVGFRPAALEVHFHKLRRIKID